MARVSLALPRLMLAAGLVLAGGRLDAQMLRGTGFLTDSSTPAPGAVVSAADLSGRVVARALANERGEFILALPGAGTYRLTALRIGFRPTTGPEVTVGPGETQRIRLVLTGAPISLATVNVRERETCRVSADTGLAVARAWEEARTAMITSQLSYAVPLVANWIEYDRMLDSAARIVREQRVRLRQNPTTRAFRSVPANVLREQGYVVQDSTGVTYHAPDANVLLSDDFTGTHCFRLVETAAGRLGPVGIAFNPAPSRRDMREIEGTAWIDRASSELQSIEFRYLNLPDAGAAAQAGGTVEFRRLADQSWLVSRWSVRMPRLTARERSSENGLRRTIMARSSLVLRGVQITGGEVMEATRGDSVVYRTDAPVVTVRVIARDAQVPVVGATLTLEGTSYQAVADSLGRVVIPAVLSGRYRAKVATPLMTALGMTPISGEISTAPGKIDSLPLPAAAAILAHACGGETPKRDEGMAWGYVRAENARPIAGASIVASWQRDVSTIGSPEGNRLAYSERTEEIRTDSAGFWRLCGVPVRGVITLRTQVDSTSDMVRLRMNDEPLGMAVLVPRLRTLAGSDIDPSRRRSDRSLVEIVVTDDDQRPVPEVTVFLKTHDGADRSVATGVNGRAMIPDVALGAVTIATRKIGFQPGEIAARVDSARAFIPIFVSRLYPPTLDTMRVVDRASVAVAARHEEFESRRARREATASITREEIVRRNPRQLWEMLANVRGVRVTDRDGRVVATSPRVYGSDLYYQKPCFFAVMLNGVVQSSVIDGQLGYDLRTLPSPEDVYGLEVFAGPSSIPPQYNLGRDGAWCGLIAIWTR